MLRRSLIIAAAIAAVSIPASAANRPEADLSGNWLITYMPPGTDINYVIVKIDAKGAKPGLPHYMRWNS